MKTQTHFGKMFQFRTIEIDPDVVCPELDERGNDSFRVKTVKGKFFRVIPINAKEVFAIQMMEHRVDKFAPAGTMLERGDGILISADAMAKLDA